MSKYLGKADILGADDVKFEDVPVPEWGGMVRVKALNGEEKDAFENSVTTMRRQKDGKAVRVPNNRNARAKLVAKSVVDENGALIFSEEEIETLGKKSAKALDRVVEVSMRLSRLKESDLTELANSLKNDQPAD